MKIPERNPIPNADIQYIANEFLSKLAAKKGILKNTNFLAVANDSEGTINVNTASKNIKLLPLNFNLASGSNPSNDSSNNKYLGFIASARETNTWRFIPLDNVLSGFFKGTSNSFNVLIDGSIIDGNISFLDIADGDIQIKQKGDCSL